MTVPKLNLAPKLKRPLSLWNPLDYLLLLYWVFYFPQALRWYVAKYSNGEKWQNLNTWQNKWQFLRQHPPLLNLWLQIILTLSISTVIFIYFIQSILRVQEDVLFGLLFGLAIAIFLNTVISYEGVIEIDVVVFTVLLSIGNGMAIISVHKVGSITTIILIILWSITAIRLENWFWSLLSFWFSPPQKLFFTRTTVLPIPNLQKTLANWLRQDWETTITNLNEILAYTQQFIPVINSLNQVLAEIPEEQIIYRVAQLAENPYDWKLVRSVASFWGISTLFYNKLRLDTSVRATAAGFSFLHQVELELALKAFGKVRNINYGEEMYSLANVLNACYPTLLYSYSLSAKELNNKISNLKFLDFPPSPHLRPTTWQTLEKLAQVVEETRLVNDNQQTSLVRNSALNRATGRLKQIINDNTPQLTLPQAEGELIVDIARKWLFFALENIALEVGTITITEPIINPYVIGPPVIGQLFVGREDILKQLESLWNNSTQIQSVIMFGHRRMGKTSILRNINERLNQDIKLAFVNLQTFGGFSHGISDVIIAITDAISDTLEISPPDITEIQALPERTFQRFLQKTLKEMPYQGLIIALDEFEELKKWIDDDTTPIDINFMKTLRTWTQLDPKLGFILAGFHDLDEMQRDYENPFFASFSQMIKVGFLSEGATRQLIRQPRDDFPLIYENEAVDTIYSLTNGQPYLVNLIGFLLISRFNQLRFEQQTKEDERITLADVEAIINDRFYQQGSYYFDGVWNQAGSEILGQREILQILAPYPEGLTVEELEGKVTLPPNANFDDAIYSLQHHDVISEKDEFKRVKILVELFRRWTMKRM